MTALGTRMRDPHLTWGNQVPPVKPEDVGARRR